jgi:hypothetical protein
MAEPAMKHEQTLEDLINRAFAMRESVRVHEAQGKEMKKILTALENDILDILEDQGVTKMGTSLATVSVSEQLSPTVDPLHWPEVFQYLFDNGYLELIRKQLNSGAWKELLQQGIEVPHVTPFLGRKLNMVKAS